MCDKYGEGDYWYLNPKMYARQMYTLKEKGEGAARFGEMGLRPERPITMSELLRIRNDEPEKYAEALKIFNADIRNYAAAQAITLQEAFKIADIGAPMGSMMCICRQVDRAYDERNEQEYSCLGTGVGMFKWERWPERYKG